MKAAINGIPSVSILDGWWDEGFNGDNGWAIGDREADGDEAEQDEADADEIYRLLEEEIVPRFFDRPDGLPAGVADGHARARSPRRCGSSARPGC